MAQSRLFVDSTPYPRIFAQRIDVMRTCIFVLDVTRCRLTARARGYLPTVYACMCFQCIRVHLANIEH